ncbi:alpha/beta hydrolase [Nakamurella aerolata]|uniref:Alpha/beta hydrolase n=1 Tax=Nakamurella aerolata TaxID=1656892 RepID=A0A849A8D5_9ACTN|nr:alpha/beta hydrolase [Nakamurella aerolata]NNG36819.1 alpha/beta hydrolase [Nakamurella aerolata]
MTTPITGTAQDVPYLLIPGSSAQAPVVAGWHLMDSPMTPEAFHAAIPLDGLDAWKLYLALPQTPRRIDPDEADQVQQGWMTDAVLNGHDPVNRQASQEFPGVLAALSAEFGFGAGPLGIMGGSAGGGVAAEVLAAGLAPVRAAVLMNPMIQLRPAVASMAKEFGITYTWTPESELIADRMDYPARAGEIAAHGAPAVLVISGADDDPSGMLDPAERFVTALQQAYRQRPGTDSGTGDQASAGAGAGASAEWVRVDRVAHALAEQPGIDPAPQLPGAAEFDRLAVQWFSRYLR